MFEFCGGELDCLAGKKVFRLLFVEAFLKAKQQHVGPQGLFPVHHICILNHICGKCPYRWALLPVCNMLAKGPLLVTVIQA
jgi:hypothetical protein